MHIKKYKPKTNRDKLVYGDGIVSGIVLLAIEEIPYVSIYRGISGKQPPEYAVKVTIDKTNVVVDVTVSVNYSQCVSDMAFRIQEAVKYNVESMTEYTVSSVNVSVKGVSFDDVAVSTGNNGADEKDKADGDETAEETKA